MPNAILVVMVLAVGDVLCIAHRHLLATVPGDKKRCVVMANCSNPVLEES